MPERILVVEDEESIARGLKGDLELEGYSVDVITDGDEALSRILEQTYDLLLLDIMLPGIDGYEICREVRKRGISVPIICLTAKTQEAEIILGLDLGADDYITKPFSPRELRARIRANLRKHNTGENQIFRFGDFELNTTRMELTYQGKLIQLTPTEFKLLVTFMTYPSTVLTRDQILDQVWGPDVFLSDRVVDTNIAYLRKKLAAHDSQARRFIKTIRGTGYRFDAQPTDLS